MQNYSKIGIKFLFINVAMLIVAGVSFSLLHFSTSDNIQQSQEPETKKVVTPLYVETEDIAVADEPKEDLEYEPATTASSAVENGTVQNITKPAADTNSNNQNKSSGSSSQPSPTPAPTPVTPSSCPATTKSCIPCTSATSSYCRFEPGKTEGYVGWSCQNNNPGNIRYSSARIGYIQAMGGPPPCGERFDSRGGTYMIFSSYNDGRNALKAYMKAINTATHTAYGECKTGNCSLQYVFSKYAPYDPNYAQNIADKIGVTKETSLNWVIQNKFEELISAIEQKEGFFSN